MERTLATVSTDGQLVLPAKVQSELGIPPGARVEIVLRDRDIRLLVQDQERLPATDARRIIDELRGMFAGEPSLEDEYFQTRDKDKW
jgi:AbrB family looped-hinge helix DNA binding protein